MNEGMNDDNIIKLDEAKRRKRRVKPQSEDKKGPTPKWKLYLQVGLFLGLVAYFIRQCGR
jgi:hypothetical protein